MKEVYIVFTMHEDSNSILTDCFDSFEKATKMIDDNSDAQCNLENGKLTSKYGTGRSIPQPVYDFLFLTANVLYGTTVKHTTLDGGYSNTYRFVIKKDVK